jgi:hypothetical protein
MNDTQDTSLSAVYAETPGGMPRREFTSQKVLQDHAEQTDKVCVMEGIAIRQRQLSPDQYEIVDVRTSRGVLRSALLIGGRPRRLSARRCGSSVSVSN